MYLVKVKKIKLTFLIFFLLLICSFSFALMAQENATNENVFADSDQDGLSDEKESIYKTDPKNPDSDSDGYSDGSEVNSGYDPTKPAPGDKLITSNTPTTSPTTSSSANLTEEISSRIATMVSSGESSDGFDMASINSLIEESMSNTTTFSDLPKIDESTIKILAQNYSEFSEEKEIRKKKEDNEAYLSAIFYIISNNLPHSIESKSAIESFSNELVAKIPSIISNTNSGMDYFTNLADNGATILDKLNELEVPKDMLDIHIKGLQLANYAISLKETVKIDSADPVASLVSLSAIENILTLSNDFITEIEVKLEELDLTDFILEQNL